MKIALEIVVNKSLEKVWELWTNPADVCCWNIPFPEWHTPKAEIDLRAGGRFFFRMESKDKKEGFDYSGTYDRVIKNNLIEYTLKDGRKVQNSFIVIGTQTKIIEIFEPEENLSIEMQSRFCKGVLEAFKTYAENQSGSFS
jgi:uncharacterized protein YndB with AHSA1/START domain